MKYTEFESKVIRLGYKVKILDNRVAVTSEDSVHCVIDKECVNQLDSRWVAGSTKELFDLCVELARTPINERVDLKCYQYKLNIPFLKEGTHYLNKVYGEFMLNTHGDSVLYQTVFTREEVAHLDLSSFEEIEYV